MRSLLVSLTVLCLTSTAFAQDELVLTGPDSYFLGLPANFTVTGAEPSETVNLYFSWTPGEEICPGFLMGACLSFGMPIPNVGNGVVDESGIASISARVTAGVGLGETLLFQAVVLRGADTVVSNLLMGTPTYAVCDEGDFWDFDNALCSPPPTGGFEEGYAVGYDDGYFEGDVSGYELGFADGTAVGYEAGYGTGFSDGADAAYEEGLLDVSACTVGCLPCADGEGLIYNADAGAFECLNIYDKDNDTTPVWEDCDDNDAVLNHVNADGDQSSSCDGDCNDTDETINPGNTEMCGTAFDENCDGIIETATFCNSTYTGGGQTIYMMNEETLPEGNAATWYQEICEAAGLRPVSCDPEIWTAGYDASAYNAVPLNAEHYGCNVSSGVATLTGWTDILTFHMPYNDDQGVCQNGCSIDGDPVFPICTP